DLGGVTGMHGLAHAIRAERLLQTCRHRAGIGERMSGARGVQAEDCGGRRRGAEAADRAGGVPELVMRGHHGGADARADLVAGDRDREPVEDAAPRVVQGVRGQRRLVERGRMAGKSLEDCGHLRLSPFPVFPALETVYKRLSERQREAFSPWRNSSATCWWW